MISLYSGICAEKNAIIIPEITKGIANKMIPSNKQSFALFESSLLIAKKAISPPNIVKKIGNKNHHALLFLYPSRFSPM